MWSEGPQRSAVLRGGAAAVARPAQITADLRTSPFATSHAVDARLTDPHLQGVVDLARVEAIAEGHAEGHVAGYAAGVAAAEAEAHATAQQAAQQLAAAETRRDAQLAAALDALAEAAEAFRRKEATSLADVEGVVADLSLEIARAIVGRELALSENPGRDAVVRALALAPHDCPATARLHPEDAAGLGPLDGLGAGRALAIVADPSVERGGCVVDAAGRQVDAQVGPALERVAAALRGDA